MVRMRKWKLPNHHAPFGVKPSGRLVEKDKLRFSRPVNISSTAANCPVRLIDCRTWSGFNATSKPFTIAVPPSCLSSVVRILTIVVLPAPLEPSRAKISRFTSKSMPFRTSVSLKDFRRPFTSIAFSIPLSPFYFFLSVTFFMALLTSWSTDS